MASIFCPHRTIKSDCLHFASFYGILVLSHIQMENAMPESSTTKSYSSTILVDQSPGDVFNAVNDVRGWWSQGVVGGTEKLNDEFVFEVKGVHRSKQKLIESVPGKRVVWLITESDMSFLKDRQEWTNTRVIFDISKKGNKTQLVFTHDGLIPGIECYDICTPAWSEYVQHSLYQLIVTGKGDPNLEGRRIQEIQA